METLSNVIENKCKPEIVTIVDVKKFASIVKIMSSSCFLENEYHSEYYEIIRRYVIVKYFTNIKVNEKTINRIFEQSQHGTWFREIEAVVVACPIWKAIETAVANQLDYLIKTRESAFDRLCRMLADNVPTEDSISAIQDIANKIQSIDNKQIIEKIVSHSEEGDSSDES